MAIGSINELETVLIVAYNIQYIDFEHLNEFQEKITILRKMISKFKDSLEEW